jgi:ribosomal protein L9
MEIILLENIDKLGSRGQLVKVADGYGRNFLLPKKLAVAATTQNRKWVDQQRVRFLKLEAKEKADAADLSTLLEDVSVTVIRKAGDKGNLFGSVKLHREVTATVKVHVEPDEESKAKIQAAAEAQARDNARTAAAPKEAVAAEVPAAEAPEASETGTEAEAKEE